MKRESAIKSKTTIHLARKEISIMLRNVVSRGAFQRAPNSRVKNGESKSGFKKPELETKIKSSFCTGSGKPENPVALQMLPSSEPLIKNKELLQCKVVAEIVSSVPPQREDHQLMQDKIRTALKNPDTLKSFIPDLEQMLTFVGLDQATSQQIGHYIIKTLQEETLLSVIENKIFAHLRTTIVDPATGVNFIDAIDPKLSGRGELIFKQLEPYLQNMKGKDILDFGAGDGAVTQMIFDNISNKTVGIDVQSYGKSKVPIWQYDGKTVPFCDENFDCVVATNVFHHEKNNQQCLDELHRVLKPGGAAVIIETVPIGDSDEEAAKDWERTFLLDYTYNRLFHDADIPVPGTFETFRGWSVRLKRLGFEVKEVVDFGFDQKIMRDRHGLILAEKNERTKPVPEDL